MFCEKSNSKRIVLVGNFAPSGMNFLVAKSSIFWSSGLRIPTQQLKSGNLELFGLKIIYILGHGLDTSVSCNLD